ncbi:DUF3427 domain-containing protein [Bdellovibrio bacteriovorus]|uniref:HNH endonuclease n=1 Tax=Bdellovibrio bacteriovorus TaxID=959 RepID=UPI0035A6823E
MFSIDRTYTRKQIRKSLGLSADIGGILSTGYAKYQNDWFIFVNIGVPGTTGHDYGNYWEGTKLHWFAKNRTKLEHPQIKDLLSGKGKVYIFTRTSTKEAFAYRGLGTAISVEDISPVKIVWRLTAEEAVLFGEEIQTSDIFFEGSSKTISVNTYERDRFARSRCLSYYGYNCVVCDFNFEKFYGELGIGYIHVHHLKPLSNIGSEYQVDPIQDLRPVCPNCHAMIHSKKEPISLERLKSLIKK